MVDIIDKPKKRKRPHVHWYALLNSLEDMRLSQSFWLFKSNHKKWSNDRCAWQVLKRYYSLNSLRRVRFGLSELFKEQMII